MKLLIVGGGGREHALAWKLAGEGAKPALFCAPGNAGTAPLGTNLDLAAEDVPGLLDWARRERPDLTVVGPEAPLCAGLADAFAREGLRVFGPGRAAAALEGSKAFAKEVMQAAGVPTAEARRFEDAAEAEAYVRDRGAPIVVKADGLAAGKGVAVCATVEEAVAAVRAALCEGAFGEAGRTVLVEDCLEGEELSVLALVDGEHVVPLASSQDHKRALDGDRGPNTGGMGAYSPAPRMDPPLAAFVTDRILQPVLDELRRRGIPYQGVLYAGLMLTADGPRVLEFNCRFGDPETQAVLPRLAGDLLPALLACTDGTLAPNLVRWRPEACVCVVMAAGGYPGAYAKGLPIEGLADAETQAGVTVFHAGTAVREGQVVTAGGRVLGVTALGADLPEAVARAYAGVDKIRFEGAQARRDIAARALGTARP